MYGGEFSLYKINPANASISATIGAVAGSIFADMKYAPDGYLYFVRTASNIGSLYRLNPNTAQVSLVASYSESLNGLEFLPQSGSQSVNQPEIIPALSGNKLILSWPSSASDYVLETSPKLGPGASWTPITSGIVTNGGNLVLTNSVTGTNAFFRLHKQ
ncbi:MAG: hypothetical protein WDM76_05340 [Limisphaerales bacterium]